MSKARKSVSSLFDPPKVEEPPVVDPPPTGGDPPGDDPPPGAPLSTTDEDKAFDQVDQGGEDTGGEDTAAAALSGRRDALDAALGALGNVGVGTGKPVTKRAETKLTAKERTALEKAYQKRRAAKTKLPSVSVDPVSGNIIREDTEVLSPGEVSRAKLSRAFDDPSDYSSTTNQEMARVNPMREQPTTPEGSSLMPTAKEGDVFSPRTGGTRTRQAAYQHMSRAHESAKKVYKDRQKDISGLEGELKEAKEAFKSTYPVLAQLWNPVDTTKTPEASEIERLEGEIRDLEQKNKTSIEYIQKYRNAMAITKPVGK